MAAGISHVTPPGDRVSEVIRRLTARLLQYPHSVEPRPEVIKQNAAFFHPLPDSSKAPPVSGLAAIEGLGGIHVTIFTTREEIVLTQSIGTLFDFPVMIGTLYTGKFRLCARGGDSLGFGAPSGATGTLACVVEDAAKDEFALGCNHIIADENKGTRNADEVWSPGALDGGTNANRVGLLTDFEDVHTGGVRTNVMDAAMARLDKNAGAPHLIHSLGSVTGVELNPAYNTNVQKYGNATQLTTGDLTFKNVSLLVPFDGGQALFVDQYGLVGDFGLPFANDGDSGALVLNKKGEALGLVMAVAGTGEITVANPIDPILKRFGVSF